VPRQLALLRPSIAGLWLTFVTWGFADMLWVRLDSDLRRLFLLALVAALLAGFLLGWAATRNGYLPLLPDLPRDRPLSHAAPAD
jgi:hypothetical protein